MSVHSEVSHTRSVPSEDTTVLPTLKEKESLLDIQSGENDKHYAQSKYAKQKRWKEKNVGGKDKQAKEKLLTKVRKDMRSDNKKMGPQAGVEGPIETVSEDGSVSGNQPDEEQDDEYTAHYDKYYNLKRMRDNFVQSGKVDRGIRNIIGDLNYIAEKDRLEHEKKKEELSSALEHSFKDPFYEVRILFRKMGITEDEKVISIFENVFVLYVKLSRDKTWLDISTTLFLYAKTHTQKSALALVYECLKSVFYNPESELEPQSGMAAPHWLKCIRDANMNWTLIRNNPAFKQISKLLSISIALGLCEATAFGFDLKSMGLFASSSTKVQYGATDLVSAAMSTFVHFMECGYMCFQTRSLRPILYGDMNVQRFNELYQRCMMNADYHKSGNLMSFSGLSDADFAKELEDCLDLANKLIQMSLGSFEKSAFSRYRDRIIGWISDFNQTRVQGGLRVAPYTIGIYGRTAVGKSSLANILMVFMLKANGFDASDERMVTLNEADKYDSNMRSSVNGIFIDDLGNTKAQFVQEAPTSKIIRICNNVRNYAVMADLAQKGKVAIEPKVVVITKNVKDSCASVYSNEPTSITRREHITLTVKVKERYADHNGMLSPRLVRHYGLHDADVPDLWDITVERTKLNKSTIEGASPNIGWEIVNDMEDISIRTLMKYLIGATREHFKGQEALVNVCSGLSQRLMVCPSCSMPLQYGICVSCGATGCAVKIQRAYRQSVKRRRLNDVLDKQAGLSASSALALFHAGTWIRMQYRAATVVDRFWRPLLLMCSERVGELTGIHIVERLEEIENNVLISIAMLIPSRILNQDRLSSMLAVRALMRSQLLMQLFRGMMCFWIIYLGFMSMYYPALAIGLIFPIYIIGILYMLEREKLAQRMVSQGDTVNAILQRFRDSHVQYVGTICVGLGLLYVGVTKYRAFTAANVALSHTLKEMGRDLIPQSDIDPKTDEDIETRDLQQNTWAVPRVSRLPSTHHMKTITCPQLCSKVARNIVHLTFTTSNGKTFESNGFFPCSNVMMIPHHVLLEEDMEVSVVRNEHHGGKFRAPVSKRYAVKIDGQDLALLWIPNGGDWSNLMPYISLVHPTSKNAVLNYKEKNGDMKVTPIWAEAGLQRSEAHPEFMGALYRTEFPTFRGLCMAVVVSDSKDPNIYGFHVAGKNGQTIGCCACPNVTEITKAIEQLRKIPGVLLSHSTGTMPAESLGIKYFESDKLHVKSPLNFIPETLDAQYKAYGSVIGRAKYYSEAVDTPISAIVHEECGVPQRWGKPPFGVGYPWQVALMKRLQPAKGVPGSHLRWAVNDYQEYFFGKMTQFKKLVKEIVPLSREESINGILGRRFVDKMPGSTAIGYPLSGPKSQYFVDVAEPEEPLRMECVDLPQMFWEEVERIEAIYKRGERAYPVCKACLKDEPTPIGKEKVRDFLALPVAFQVIVRTYFLPIARVMSLLPFHSECAVGINAHGDEWGQLHDYVTTYGSTRILAGDYQAYDLKMPSQLTMAAFSIFITIAERMGYTEEELRIMKGVATDLCYPVVAYNGDLIAFDSTNPSGHNLTVYINCIVNSLLLRSAFVGIYGDMGSSFTYKEVCTLITYGDDCIGSVNPLYPEYNHITVAKYLESVGMVFTMPDKTSKPIPYMGINDTDFLKRKSVYHPALRTWLGALDEMSIFKSLHCVLKSTSVTLKEQSIMNIDGALREWFAHGEEVYEMRRVQMKHVAGRYGVQHACRELELSYRERIDKWIVQYREESWVDDKQHPAAS